MTFLHLQRSMASSLFNLRAWQSSCTTSFQVFFGLPLGREPCNCIWSESLSKFKQDFLYNFLQQTTSLQSIGPSELAEPLVKIYSRCLNNSLVINHIDYNTFNTFWAFSLCNCIILHSCRPNNTDTLTLSPVTLCRHVILAASLVVCSYMLTRPTPSGSDLTQDNQLILFTPSRLIPHSAVHCHPRPRPPSQQSMKHHVAKVAAACHYHLWCLQQIRCRAGQKVK